MKNRTYVTGTERSLVYFPSYLILDFVNNKPIHVVFSYDEVSDTGYVVTAYIPDSDLWTDNFRRRK